MKLFPIHALSLRSRKPAVRLRFGECVLDTDLRQLVRAGRLVPLTPKAFRLLEVLAERRPDAVGRPELRRLVWPEEVVGGTSIARVLCEVRAAIGDRARPALFIRTVQRFGYAFFAEAVDEASVAPRHTSSCAVQWGARLVALVDGENLIGRAADAEVSIAMDRVSRRHARITVAAGRALIEDLGSKHGTRVGDRPIDGPVELKHGDHIGVGPVLLVFRDSRREDPTF